MHVYGLIGDPVEHSLSPAMFNAAFDASAIEAVYGTFHVDHDDLETALHGAEALDVRGLNVTTPHKKAIIELIDPVPEAASIGAVNTIDLTTSPPRGWNTDAFAMEVVIDDLDPDPGVALVLGAGGAGRAYAHALYAAGWQLIIANRTVARAEQLAARLEATTPVSLEDAADLLGEVDLVVNATTVGLEDHAQTPIAPEGIGPDHIVIDAIYGTHETQLLRHAKAVGATGVGGDRLLLEQALASYERWFDSPAPRDVMAEALREALGR